MKNLLINRALAAKTKKLFTLLLAVAASVGVIFAENGTCGDNLTWDLTNGVLTISGIGAMNNYRDEYYNADTCVTNAPWGQFRDNITSVIINTGVSSIGNSAFTGCFGLTSVIIPNSVTSIGDEAFHWCSNLTSVTVPNSVTSIGKRVFRYCTSLTAVTIPNNVSVGQWVFSRCTNLTFVTAPTYIFEVPETDWVYYPHSLKSVTFNGGELTYNVLGVLARSYKTLTSLDMSGVSSAELGDEAFKGFYNLQSLVLPNILTKINYMAVADCKNLQSIDIPASVEEIDQSAFENCRSLKTITFGGSANPVSGRFNAPASTTSQLQSIGNWAFYNCHELQNLEIPEGVTFIGDGAFYGCVYLEDLTLPSSIQSIGDNTFALCAKMQKIVIKATVPPTIHAKTFYDVNRKIPVYVPDESVDAYMQDALWGEFDIRGSSDPTTSISQTPNQKSAITNQKLIINSQLFIQRGNELFNAQGARVK